MSDEIKRQTYEPGYVRCQVCGNDLVEGVHICATTMTHVATFGLDVICINLCRGCALCIGELAQMEVPTR